MSDDAPRCRVYRCSRQPEMYLYLRQDLTDETLPETLRARVGQLTEVMTLTLTPERRLARVDPARLRAALAAPGYYLQLPPGGIVATRLYAGD
ncbi:YcgL domain-containing protein [Flagellatimonas centrodinii]|uniref:YcgL domain-containing protein n=1 Tax=Flagellatimonas centrodinii TaxID=2806210 RepID=UPI001FEF66F0|nr:YcgL domain-containing protein [Flagellatimonas centrodinii]